MLESCSKITLHHLLLDKILKPANVEYWCFDVFTTNMLYGISSVDKKYIGFLASGRGYTYG